MPLYILLKLKEDKFLQEKLCSVMTHHFAFAQACSPTEHQNLREQQYTCSACRHNGRFQFHHILCSIQTESVWAFLYCKRQCNWCCVYLGTLEEYLMPILRKRDHNLTLFQLYRMPLHFISQFETRWMKSFKGWHLGYLVRLILNHMILFMAVY